MEIRNGVILAFFWNEGPCSMCGNLTPAEELLWCEGMCGTCRMADDAHLKEIEMRYEL